MNDKDFNNEFKFSVSQGDMVLCERIFCADNFNPFTRYSINIRDMLSSIINSLQRTLSRKNYTTTFDGSIDFNEYKQKMINSYPYRYKKHMKYEPQYVIQKFDEKTIRGVECKIGLYINNKTILERIFYVDGYNPVASNSIDLVEEVNYITSKIERRIIDTDINNMWDDYDLINKCGLNMSLIRELSLERREFLLSTIKR